MKKLLTILTSLLLSTSVLADELRCGYLHIAMINNTGHNCILTGKKVINSYRVDGAIPEFIPNNTLTPSFRIQQTYTSGPQISLEYQCENKTIKITSQQDYCFMAAGQITGKTQLSNNAHADYATMTGSYWGDIHGQIIWKFY